MASHTTKPGDNENDMDGVGKDPAEYSMNSLEGVHHQQQRSALRTNDSKEFKRKSVSMIQLADVKAPSASASQSTTSTAAKRLEFAQQLREDFRQLQLQRKANQVQHVVLGKGLGEDAEDTLREGYYVPSKVMKPLTDEDMKMWSNLDLKKNTLGESEPVTGSNSRSSSPSFSARKSVDKNPLMDADSEEDEKVPIIEKFRCTYKQVATVVDARMEINENIRTSENELEAVCFPFTFSEMSETLASALMAIERGKLDEKVALPMYIESIPPTDPKLRQQHMEESKKNPLYLVGAPAVLHFVRQSVLPHAYEVVPVVHSIQWMLQYTIAFLRSFAAQGKEDAEVRVELLSRCVRLLGNTENFSSVALTIESKAEEYDAFWMLKESAERDLSGILSDVESVLEGVMLTPFPARRQHLLSVEQGVHARLRQVLVFLNEMDYSWVPTVYFHMEWKLKFLSKCFQRIHEKINPMYAEASLGFIDSCLYDMVSDSRVTGKVAGGVPIRIKVPRACQLEYDRVTGRLRFQMIATSLKGSGSRIVGLQLCMGARYILRQSTPEFDLPWGFHMNEQPIKDTNEDEKSEIIANFYTRVRAKLAAETEARQAAEAKEKAAAAEAEGSDALSASTSMSFSSEYS